MHSNIETCLSFFTLVLSKYFVRIDFISISVPPSTPRILGDRGKQLSNSLPVGPFKEGDPLTIQCVATGGEHRSSRIETGSHFACFRRAASERSLVPRQHHHWQDLHRQREGSGAEHPDHPEAGQGRHGPEVQMRGLQHQHEPGPGDLDHPGHHVWVATDLSFDPAQGPSLEGVMEWDAEKFSVLPPSAWPRSHDKFIFSSPAGSQDRYWGPAHGVRQRIQPQVCVLGLPPSCGDILVPETVTRSQGQWPHEAQLSELIHHYPLSREGKVILFALIPVERIRNYNPPYKWTSGPTAQALQHLATIPDKSLVGI